MLSLMELATVASGEQVLYLADIVSDGTSNNIILTAVRTVLAIVQAAIIGVFAVKVFKNYSSSSDGGKAGGGGGGWKSNWEEMKDLAFAQGALAVVWIIAELGAGLFQGVFGR